MTAAAARRPGPRLLLVGLAVLLATAVVAALVLSGTRKDAPPVERVPYGFAPVAVTGGGWVTGLVAHPSGSVFARTDVGGAWRWDEQRQAWDEVLGFDRVDEPRNADYGVDGVAVAPSDPERVYLLVGDTLERREGRVLRSDDGGTTWESAELDAAVHGNAEWRQAGDRLAVSPDDPDVVLVGTREDGLLRSEDGGEDWERVDGLPEADDLGGEAAGVAFLVFGEDGDELWAGVQGVGVLRSDDGGQDWDLVHPTPGATPRDAELGPDGRLWVAVAGGDGLVRVDRDGGTPVSPGGSPAVVAVDPEDAEHVVVGDEGVRDQFLWQSTDGGESWTALDVEVSSPGVPWVAQSDLDGYLSAGELQFDPARPGRLWFAEGTGVWTTDDLAGGRTPSGPLVWRGASDGIEELVSNDAVRPPGGALITAHWDRPLFLHAEGEPARLLPSERFGSGWDLEVDPADPAHVLAVVDDHRYCCAEDGRAGQSGRSRDGGRTWTRFASLESGTHPEELRFGDLEVLGDGTLVWAPSEGGRVHRSTDSGATWTPAEYPGSEHHFARFLQRDVLVRTDDDALLLLDVDGVMRSDDGGATWQRRRSEGLPRPDDLRFNATMVALPGRPDELLLTTGLLDEGSHGLFRSSDGGDTWTELQALQDVGRVGVGPALQPGAPPVLFATGRQGDTAGLWRSLDEGATWQLASEAPAGRYQEITVIAPDPEVPGRVHLGFRGTGFLTGDPR